MSETNKINKSFLVLSLVYIAVASLIIITVYFYSKNNFEKEIARLQTEISTNSEIKLNNLKKWIVSKRDSIESVSDNLSVRMYLSENNEESPLDEKLAQEQFIRNYLVSEARKTGFSNPANNNIKANVTSDSDSALAIFNADESQVIALGMQKNTDGIYKTISKPSSYSSYFKVLFSGDNQKSYVIFLKSIKHIQSDGKVGYVMGIKKLDDEFFDIANFPPDSTKFSRTDIVVKEKDGLVLLNSKIGNAYERLSYSNQQQSIAELEAIKQKGDIVEKFNRKSEKVFSLAKKIYGNVYIIYSINQDLALKTAKDFHRNLIFITSLIVVSIGLLMLLVWRHSSSVKYRRISSELNKQTNLLKLVTDNQLQSMFLLSDNENVVFANKTFLNKNHLTIEDVLDKPLSNVVGASLSKEYIETSKIDYENPVIITKRVGDEGNISYIQRKCVPVNNIADEGRTYHLFAENDITALMKERQKYEANLNNVIETLIRIIEQRSSYFHNHSQQLSELSIAVAESLKVDERIRRAVEIASKLCNLYLALLPRDLINKQNKLSEDERRMFEEFPNKTIEIIRDLEFDAPVIETLTQIAERPDGTGPSNLSDSHIIESAKILKVVNDYIAMISDRPYRSKMSPDIAIDMLLKEKDKKYSSRVIFALANYIDNKDK